MRKIVAVVENDNPWDVEVDPKTCGPAQEIGFKSFTIVTEKELAASKTLRTDLEDCIGNVSRKMGSLPWRPTQDIVSEIMRPLKLTLCVTQDQRRNILENWKAIVEAHQKDIEGMLSELGARCQDVTQRALSKDKEIVNAAKPQIRTLKGYQAKFQAAHEAISERLDSIKSHITLQTHEVNHTFKDFSPGALKDAVVGSKLFLETLDFPYSQYGPLDSYREDQSKTYPGQTRVAMAQMFFITDQTCVQALTIHLSQLQLSLTTSEKDVQSRELLHQGKLVVESLQKKLRDVLVLALHEAELLGMSSALYWGSMSPKDEVIEHALMLVSTMPEQLKTGFSLDDAQRFIWARNHLDVIVENSDISFVPGRTSAQPVYSTSTDGGNGEQAKSRPLLSQALRALKALFHKRTATSTAA